MKIRVSNHKSLKGFTLIEMIGVLAVIAILASLLIPKIFEAINNARVNNAAMTTQTIKTALADHYAKFGSFAVDGTTATPTALTLTDGLFADFDAILLKEGFIDKSFQVKIGDNVTTDVRLVAAAAADAAGSVDGAYNLDGGAEGTAVTDTPVNDATGSHVVEALISGVALEDARALNRVIDGTATALGEDATSGNDYSGRVKYAKPGTGLSTTTVYVYLTHR